MKSLVLALLLLTPCAYASNRFNQSDADALVGKEAYDVIQKLGIPERQMELSGTTFLEYSRCASAPSNVFRNGTVTPGIQRCDTLLVEVKGEKVVKASVRTSRTTAD